MDLPSGRGAAQQSASPRAALTVDVLLPPIAPSSGDGGERPWGATCSRTTQVSPCHQERRLCPAPPTSRCRSLGPPYAHVYVRCALCACAHVLQRCGCPTRPWRAVPDATCRCAVSALSDGHGSVRCAGWYRVERWLSLSVRWGTLGDRRRGQIRARASRNTTQHDATQIRRYI